MEVKTRKQGLKDRYGSAVDGNYDKLEDYIDDVLLWPEMRYIRDEIIDCLLIGAYQAAIALTNHFLEKCLKLALIYNTTGGKQVQFGEQMKTYEEALSQYDDSDLSQTINACCSKGIFDKQTKKKLQDYREKFRNSYGHAKAEGIFGNHTAPAAIVPTHNSASYKIEINPIARMPYIHGMAQQILAEMDALPYFQYVYEAYKKIEQRVERKQ